MSGKFRGAALVFMAALVLTAFVSPKASAETLTFQVQVNHPNIVDLSFYSQDRNYAWPGGDQVYIIDDYNVNTFTLNCAPGEKICYGAWVRGDPNTYWGSGYNDNYGCQACCFYCNGGTTNVQVLNP